MMEVAVGVLSASRMQGGRSSQATDGDSEYSELANPLHSQVLYPWTRV